MANFNPETSDYNDVASRIRAFKKKFPNMVLRPATLDKPYELVVVGEKLHFIVVAAAYRTPDDPNPGIGMAMEPYPGKTPFTRDSELQNAETAAWGRALAATGEVDTKKGIASREEVQGREGYTPPALAPHMNAERIAEIRDEAIAAMSSTNHRKARNDLLALHAELRGAKTETILVPDKDEKTEEDEKWWPQDPAETMAQFIVRLGQEVAARVGPAREVSDVESA